MKPGVTVCIPSIPPRRHSTFHRAIQSVTEQTRQPNAVAVAVDHAHAGAAVTRNAALKTVETEWTAFLDDDDMLRPFHLEALMDYAEATGADLVYPHFDVISMRGNAFDPFADREGQPFDAELLRTRNYIPVTVLARTELLRDAGGFRALNDSTEPGASPCDDHGAWLSLLDAGGTFAHLPRRTWIWNWHGPADGGAGNTSGRGDRW
jgi:glycosyltransferase involved in cell wall biosynthesis